MVRKIFSEVSSWLTKAGVLIKKGTLMDATIIEAPSSTKNKAGERDFEMHQTKKGNQWHFGCATLKAHVFCFAGYGYLRNRLLICVNGWKKQYLLIKKYREISKKSSHFSPFYFGGELII